jgi:hypothetical protein
VVINDGVQAGDHVVLAPQNYETYVNFEAPGAKTVPAPSAKVVADAGVSSTAAP